MRLTPWVKCVSTLWGHGSNSRVHFMGYSLFYVWVTVWVRRLTHILTHTVLAKKVSKTPEIIRFREFSVRWLHSGYFCFLSRTEIQQSESSSKAKKFPALDKPTGSGAQRTHQQIKMQSAPQKVDDYSCFLQNCSTNLCLSSSFLSMILKYSSCFSRCSREL